MLLTIKGPTDVNGNRREIPIPMTTGAERLTNADVVNVSAEEFRRLAVAWDFPLNDEDARIVEERIDPVWDSFPQA